VKNGVVVEVVTAVLKKVGGRNWRLYKVEFNVDLAKIGVQVNHFSVILYVAIR
jgi:hypothetical protein